MTTKNKIIENTGWQDVETLTETSFEEDDIYVLTIKGGTIGEVCVAESTPDEALIGHPVKANENFIYKHKSGDKLFIKSNIAGTVLILT